MRKSYALRPTVGVMDQRIVALRLPLHYRLCNVCTSDFAGAKESKLNRRVLMAFRKRIDGLLKGAEITALRKQYQMTQGQAARLFGGGPVAFSKYENGDVAQSESMAQFAAPGAPQRGSILAVGGRKRHGSGVHQTNRDCEDETGR